MKRERENPGCPCNCKRRAAAPHAIGSQDLRRRRGPALTREPGDLPDAVVLRPARVRRADGKGVAARGPCQPQRGDDCDLHVGAGWKAAAFSPPCPCGALVVMGVILIKFSPLFVLFLSTTALAQEAPRPD